ncbi:hypothetical protein J8L98_24670, partial [Pseudoalteromonas sp. MMG013]|uniref:calcium-binding protein n=1 Tax=Pseudoalteromonas sp. MMG013 TaxID=2822687 RepID=UPI001B445D6A
HITLETLNFSRSNDDLVINITNTNDLITIKNYFKHTSFEIENIVISERTHAFNEILNLKGVSVNGATSNSDALRGSEQKNTIDGLAGDDTLYGYGGDDELSGGLGDDKLYGGDHDDTLYGNEGNDILHGGSQNDI